MKRLVLACLVMLLVVAVMASPATASTKIGPSVTTLSAGTVQGSAWYITYGGYLSWIEMGVKNNNINASKLVYVQIYDSGAGATAYMYGKSVTRGQVKTWDEPSGSYLTNPDGWVRTRCDGIYGVKKYF